MNLERLYLDYNATSPLSKSVINWLRSGELLFANPSSQHTDGKSTRRVVNETRAVLYKTFNKFEKDTKLFFHSGATEAFHTFAHSFSEAARLSEKDLLICFSRVDHPAVSNLSEMYFGPHVKFHELKRDKNLHYCHHENFEFLSRLKEKNPDLIILYHHLWVHNETGQVSPLAELELFKSLSDCFIHVDAVQVPGKIPNWKDLSEGHIWTFSAHKFGAFKGIGFSFFRASLPFHPLLLGGAQQGNLRSGTENIQGVHSTRLALQDLLEVEIDKTHKHRRELVTFMREKLQGVGEVIDDENMASNTIYFYLNHLSSDIALALFDLNGLEISAGSACSSGAAKPSAVLKEMSLHAVAKNGLRLSLPFDVDEEFLNKIKELINPVFNKLHAYHLGK